MKIILVVACLPLLVSACAVCDSGPGLYVRGTMTSMIGPTGSFVKTKETPRQNFVLARPGDSFNVEGGTAFTLTVPEVVNLGANALQVAEADTITTGSTIYKVSLVESCTPYVVMDKQCKIVNWYNPYRIPEVRISNYDDQLIMTPLLDNNLSIIGYEIRLGDHKMCGSPALKQLNRLKGGKTIIARPIKSNTPETPWNLADLEGAKPD